MIFIVSVETGARGSYTIGHISVSEEGKKELEIRQLAQKKVVEMLVSAGFSRSKIGIQVTDYTTLEVGLHRVSIITIPEFDSSKASILATLLR